MSQEQPVQASKLQYVQYDSSKEAKYLTAIRQLISKDLSEPYSIYVYRYFLYQWGHLCFMVHVNNTLYQQQMLTASNRLWMKTIVLSVSWFRSWNLIVEVP